PTIGAFGEPYFLFAQSIAVCGGGVLLMRRAVSDDAVDDDKRGPILGAAKYFNRAREGGRVVGVVDPHDVPVIRLKPLRNVLAHGEIGVALDGYGVAVVNPAQVCKLEVSGKRRRLAGYALHHVAIAADRVDVEIEKRRVRSVVARGEPARRDRHTDAIAATLSERAGGSFDAGGMAVFRMSGRHAVELAKVLDVVEGDRWISADALAVHAAYAGKMQKRIKQH